VSTLVDVGGCRGQTLHMIIFKYSTIKGINFDLPQFIEKAPSYPSIYTISTRQWCMIVLILIFTISWLGHRLNLHELRNTACWRRYASLCTKGWCRDSKGQKTLSMTLKFHVW